MQSPRDAEQIRQRLRPRRTSDESTWAGRTDFLDAGHGFDRLGMSARGIAAGHAVTEFLYRHWFRVSAEGREHVPRSGRCLVVPNHSGTLPFDGMMIYADLLRKTERVPRVIADHFVPKLPWINTLFARAGAVSGSRTNFRFLLEHESLVIVFPEGAPGPGKPFRERYQLQTWRVGHAELAIRHRTPIVPTAVIGAEEQMPQLARLPIQAFGAPWLPIPAVPFPLPVRYRLIYGEPLDIPGRFAAGDADDPEAVDEAADWVRASVERLVADGLAARRHIFF